VKRFQLVALFIGSLIWVVLSLASAAYAQSQGGAANRPKKRTNIDFEDQLIQGEVKKPELFYLLQKKQFNFGKLIRLRENFVPEMQKTAEDIQKVGQ